MKYFETGFITKRELYDELKLSSGLSSWNPTLEPTKIQAGVYVAPGCFVLQNDFNGTIDDVSSSSKGTIIYFFDLTKRWGIISGEDKNKGVFQTLLALQTSYPSASDGDYALVVATNTFFSWSNNQWNNTGSSVAPDSLRSTNNLSDLVSKSTARTNLDVYNKKETKDTAGALLVDTTTIDFTYDNTVGTEKITAIVKDDSISNVKITSNADIATSKIKQAVITVNNNIFANNDTQDVINNKAQGQINNLQTNINLKENTANKTATFSAIPADVKFPTEKLVKDSLDLKENLLNKATVFSGVPADIKYPTEKLVKDNLDLKENLTNKAITFSAIPADIKYPTEKLVKDNLDLKVDKIAGKGLSTNDYTTAEQTKLAGIQAGATANSTDAYLLSRVNHTGSQAISTITNLSDALSDKFSKVATSEINALVDKATLGDSDLILIEDTADTGKKKKATALNTYNYINNKLQSQFNAKVGTTGDETIAGNKTFSNNVMINAVPSNVNHLARIRDVQDYATALQTNINLKSSSLDFRQESTRFVEKTYGSDLNNGLTPDKPFQTVPTAWNNVNPSGQVKIMGGAEYNVGTFTFNTLKESIKTILDNGAKLIGTINLIAGNTSMQFYNGKISATISDGSGGTCYFNGVDLSGANITFSNGGYKFIGNSTSSPASITLSGTGGILVIQDITGGSVPLNIGAGWVVVYYNCIPAILSNAGTIIDGFNIPINSLIADQATLNVILAQTSSVYFGYYIVNFDNPVIEEMTIAKGDVFYKVSAEEHIKVYTFGNAPASFSLIVSATQRNTIVKSVDKWIVPTAGTTVVDGAKINVIATDIASASTVNLNNATGDIVNITGATTITAITLTAGIKRFVRFTNSLTLTNGANLVLPSGANITTASGDTAIFIGYASGVVRCVSYTRANGTALVGGAGSGDVSSIETSSTDSQLVLFDGTTGKSIKKSTDSGFIKLNAGVVQVQSLSGADVAIPSGTLNNFVAVGSNSIVDSGKKLNNTASPTDNDIWSGLKTKTYVDSSLSSDTVVSFSPSASAGQTLDVSLHKFSIFTCDGYATATLPATLNNAGKIMKITCSSASVGRLEILNSNKTNYFILSNDTAIFECDGTSWRLISGPEYVIPVLGSLKQNYGRGLVFGHGKNLMVMGRGHEGTSDSAFGPYINNYSPVPLTLFDTNGTSVYTGTITKWKDVQVALDYGIALTEEGVVFQWGKNFAGINGAVRSPRRIAFPNNELIDSIYMSANSYNYAQAATFMAFYAISKTGKLYSWGAQDSIWKNLGHGDAINRYTPTLIVALQDKVITKFAVSGNYGIFCGCIDSTGQLYTWGFNGNPTANGNPLGNNVSTPDTPVSVPTAVAGFTDCVDIYAEGAYVVASSAQFRGHIRVIRADGSTWASGYNGLGNLGITGTTSYRVFTRESTNKTNVVKITGGSAYTHCNSMIITADYKIYFAGSNEYGIFNNGTNSGSIDNFTLNATQLALEFQGKMYDNKGVICKAKITGFLEAGLTNCIILDGDGNLYISGYNNGGYCADGTRTDRATFNKVKLPKRVVDFIMIGWQENNDRGVLVVLEDGTMMSWGYNNNGVLGNSILVSATSYPTPRYVIGFGENDKNK